MHIFYSRILYPSPNFSPTASASQLPQTATTSNILLASRSINISSKIVIQISWSRVNTPPIPHSALLENRIQKGPAPKTTEHLPKVTSEQPQSTKIHGACSDHFEKEDVVRIYIIAIRGELPTKCFHLTSFLPTRLLPIYIITPAACRRNGANICCEICFASCTPRHFRRIRNSSSKPLNASRRRFISL